MSTESPGMPTVQVVRRALSRAERAVALDIEVAAGVPAWLHGGAVHPG